MEPRFYFTVHPGDLIKGRVLDNAHIMIVASAHWDADRARFKTRRIPSNVASIVIDSGGFTAAKRWGRYPWTPEQYAVFADYYRQQITVDFVACMDYACEPSVNRDTYRTNRQRIKATIRNEIACRDADSSLPWLPVLQGDTLEERAFDLRLRTRIGMLPTVYAGIGSVCGRGANGAQKVVKFYEYHLPGVRYHCFGMHIQALDDDAVFGTIRSWDSYGWNWGRGLKDMSRPPDYYHREGESWSQYTLRMATLYYGNTIAPRLNKTRQICLPIALSAGLTGDEIGMLMTTKKDPKS